MIEGILFSEPSEKWTLSALVKDSALLAAHPLNPEAFHLPTHRTIYRRMLATRETDVVILAEAMNVNGEADAIPALADLLNYAVGPHFDHHLAAVRDCLYRRKAAELAREMMEAANDRSDPDRFRAALAKAGEVMKMATATESTDSMVRGFSSFPTDPLPENILAGNAWLRVGDVHFFNSSAGAGKSVALIQASMAWALGLPFLGIKPARSESSTSSARTTKAPWASAARDSLKTPSRLSGGRSRSRRSPASTTWCERISPGNTPAMVSSRDSKGSLPMNPPTSSRSTRSCPSLAATS
jgi:hypothetical protein